MNFKKINNITGWIVFAIATLTYLLSMERTASFWDCGEFLVTAYKLEVAHSPGAPLYMLIGRVFALFANSGNAAMLINSMSAFASGFTILFLFWSITHFARKIITNEDTDEISKSNLISIIGAGIVGALAYTFSDTFWFSAVEAEVYATSSFFTALTFWAILKWEHAALKDPRADRWLILIFFLVGLSIGVHLLNLLTIPSVILVYYLRKNPKPTLIGGLFAFITGGIILGIVQFGIIQGFSIMASKFEIMFTNSFGMPFNTGSIVFMILVAGLIFYLIKYAKKNGKYLLYLSSFCFAFTLLGFIAPYVSTMIRSNADVPIDMVNPDNVVSLIPYLQREQYGSQPLLTGQNYDAKAIGINDDGPMYLGQKVNGKDKYVEVGRKQSYDFDRTNLFPRMWDRTKQKYYENVLGLDANTPINMKDNLSYFFNYQFNWMYWRYFMWNYSGRQNDYQGQGDPKSANWVTGIKFIDKMMGRGDIDKASDAYKNNRARNEYYMLPFILGLMGLLYHYKKRKGDFFVVFSLFIMTGLAIVVYLNNSPMQPRERDYAYISTYPFAIWIGIGVMQIAEWLKGFLKNGIAAPAVATLIATALVPLLMFSKNWDDHNRAPKRLAKDHAYNMLMSCDSNAILIVNGDNDTYPLWYLQEIEGVRPDVRILNQNLLNTDWQVEQMFNAVNKAAPVPMIWKKDQVGGSNLEYIQVYEEPKLRGKYITGDEVLNFILNPKNSKMTQSGKARPYMPVKKLFIPIDSAAVLASGIIKGIDSAVILPHFEVNYDGGVMRADLTILNMVSAIAKEGWKRPIYFGYQTPAGGFEPYLQRVGLLSKLVPIAPKFQGKNTGVENFAGVDENLKLLTETYTLGNANTTIPYYDDKAKNTLTQYRTTAADFANYLSAIGRQSDAVTVLDKMMARMSKTSFPNMVYTYDNSTVFLIDAYYRAGAKEKGAALTEEMIGNAIKDTDYYMSLSESGKASLQNNQLVTLQSIFMASRFAEQAGDAANAKKWMDLFTEKANLCGLLSFFQQIRPQQAPSSPMQTAPTQ